MMNEKNEKKNEIVESDSVLESGQLENLMTIYVNDLDDLATGQIFKPGTRTVRVLKKQYRD